MNCVLCGKPLCHDIYMRAYKGLAHCDCNSWQVRLILWWENVKKRGKK